MVSQGVAYSMLVLRIIALAASVATIALVVTNNVEYEDDEFIIDWKFQDIMAFRYVLAVAVISAVYGIIQLPIAVYYAVKQKRMIHNGFFPHFDFFGDKVTSHLLATAIGAGIGVSFEGKRWLEEEVAPNSDDSFTSKEYEFIDRGITASSVLALACLCMAIVSVISSINRSTSKGIFN